MVKRMGHGGKSNAVSYDSVDWVRLKREMFYEPGAVFKGLVLSLKTTIDHPTGPGNFVPDTHSRYMVILSEYIIKNGD